MKCSIVIKTNGQMYEVAFDGFETIGEARVKLSEIADKLLEMNRNSFLYTAKEEDFFWSLDKDHLSFDVNTYKIVKTSSIRYDHSYGNKNYITIN